MKDLGMYFDVLFNWILKDDDFYVVWKVELSSGVVCYGIVIEFGLVVNLDFGWVVEELMDELLVVDENGN